jgi:eukaryotic-like serine/threonine-protein kinase
MLSPGSSIGRYVVKKRLAEGGMAEVYLAQATGPEGFAKDVVIKVVRSFLASDQQFIDMFIAEARLSSRLNHANVVQIFDFGKHDDSYFIAMEYVRGASLFDLRKRCRERGVPFPPTLVAEIGAQVARGLQYAHGLSDKGKPLAIVHRDVTPHNVLLSFDGAVKLTDFGIAKASTSHTAPGILKGKFAYMSPEQARGEQVDARTDLFALGIVLWEMLTGGRLFDGDSEMAVPDRLNPDIPHELSEIVLKALARPVADRFQTAFELDKALATFVLRAARSVEDSSVALFMQQVYADTIAAEDGERLGTPVGTPAVQRGVVPQASSFGFGDTLAVDRSNEFAKGRPTSPSTPARAGVPSGAGRAEPLRTDQMPAVGPQRTDQMAAMGSGRTDRVPALPGTDSVASGSRPPVRTDMMPAHRSSPSQPGLVIGVTDVVAKDKVGQPKTDPEKNPLGAQPVNLDNSTIRVSDSVKLDVQRRIAEHQAAEQPRKPAEPTVLKPRVLAIDLQPAAPEPQTSPTAPATPPPATRSPALIGVSVLVALAVLAGGGYAAFGRSNETKPVAEVPVEPVKPSPPEATPPPVAEARPTETIAAVVAAPEPVDVTPDAAVVVAVAEPAPPKPLEPVVVPPVVQEPEKPTAVAKPATPTLRYGTVSIKAVPFAELLIDGRKSGEVQGLKAVKMPFGSHKVTLVHPKRSETFTVTVDGKATPELVFNANQ